MDMIRFVAEIWFNLVLDFPIFTLSEKLKALMTTFKVWNFNTFGNVKVRVDQYIKDV